jgi:hypothetical protein
MLHPRIHCATTSWMQRNAMHMCLLVYLPAVKVPTCTNQRGTNNPSSTERTRSEWDQVL